MENNWACFGENSSGGNDQVVFQQYRSLMQPYIEQVDCASLRILRKR
jgi:hypothetical protein